MGWMRVLKRPWNWAYLEVTAFAIVLAGILLTAGVTRLVTSR